MYSLQLYEQDNPAYNNNAYIIMSIYHSGTLKIYISHLTQLNNSEGWPEYCMNQLGAYVMIYNQETFHQGVTAYWNVRDWTKEQRNEVIRRANERVNDK